MLTCRKIRPPSIFHRHSICTSFIIEDPARLAQAPPFIDPRPLSRLPREPPFSPGMNEVVIPLLACYPRCLYEYMAIGNRWFGYRFRRPNAYFWTRLGNGNVIQRILFTNKLQVNTRASLWARVINGAISKHKRAFATCHTLICQAGIHVARVQYY